MSDRIEKEIDITAPLSRVWRALTDHREFGQWFRVRIDAPFVVGEVSTGQILVPGYEHVIWRAKIVRMEPETLFAYTWHPCAVDPTVDYSGETPTLVEFRLAPTQTGTRLKVTETGFDRVPAHRRAEAFRMNNQGWESQIQNIAAHVGA